MNKKDNKRMFSFKWTITKVEFDSERDAFEFRACFKEPEYGAWRIEQDPWTKKWIVSQALRVMKEENE